MKFKNVIHILLLIFLFNTKYSAQVKVGAFKSEQLKNKKVKEAYDSKWEQLQKQMKALNLNPDEFDIYLRAFKQEAIVEVWMKNKTESKYKLFKTYDICASSGSLGPKRREGDGQVPEGFYQIDLFNPNSNYYISMRINYPNTSDMILKDGKNAGGAIMIHGECVTIGCLPMTNDKIKELYVLCVEVKNRNKVINIDVFPMKLTQENLKTLETTYSKTKISFWNTLKPRFDYFENNRMLSKVNIDKKGIYTYEK